MASGMGRFVAQKNHLDQQTDEQRMPPPPINLNRSTILAPGQSNPRRAPVNLSKFSTGRSIPKFSSLAQQSPIQGARQVLDRFHVVGEKNSPQPQFRQNGQAKDAFDTDLESTTNGSDDSMDTLNAGDHNQTRVQGQNKEEYEDEDDGQGPHDEDKQLDGNGYPVQGDQQYLIQQQYQNGPVDHGEQIDDRQGESSEDGEGEEDDDERIEQQGQVPNGGYAVQYQQPQHYAQAIQHQQGRDFENIPVRGGSPNNLTSRMADARNPVYQLPARRANPVATSQTFGYQQQEEQYEVQDNFRASTIGDQESSSEDETDEEEANQQLKTYGQAPNQPQYQNQLQVHQRQQQYSQQQKPRQPNPVVGQEVPVYQRLEQVRGITGGGTFAPTELGDETTTLDSPVSAPQKKTKLKEKHRASSSPLVRKRAPSPELDYDKPTLFNMPYSELAAQPFETKPPSQRSSTIVVKGKTLSEKLEKATQLSTEAREEFLSSLSIKDWEEAGGWFVTRFGDVMKGFVDLRKERRAMAEKFEGRLGERDERVRRGRERLEAEMGDMRKGGMSILRGKSPGTF